MDQAELLSGPSRHPNDSGPIAVDPDPESEFGFTVIAPNDIRGQLEKSLSDVNLVLQKAGMSRPPQSLPGLQRLVLPGLVVDG